LEISLAVMIGLMMLSLAAPSVRGLFAEQRLRDRMREFEEFAHRAEVLARESRKEVRLVWEKEGVRIVRDQVQEGEAPLQADVPAGSEFFAFEKEEGLSLRRLAARDNNPLSEWCFWPAGVREPVEVYYSGPGGNWALRFGPIVPDPDVLSLEIR
jgi:hypothetical protein